MIGPCSPNLSHLKLSEQIMEQFSDVPANRALPSEHDLGNIFGVNRQTIRAALDELERRWLIRKVKGSGTFRTQRFEYRISRDLAPSFTQTVRAAGADPRTINSKPVIRQASPEERDILGLEAGSKVTVLERVRYIDDMPVSTAISVLPSAAVPAWPPSFPSMDRWMASFAGTTATSRTANGAKAASHRPPTKFPRPSDSEEGRRRSFCAA